MLLKSALILCCATVVSVYAYSNGAPSDFEVCENLLPKHPGDPQQGPSPYIVEVDKRQVSPGEVIKVGISSQSPTSFKGFLVQGRKSNYEKELSPRGSFQLGNNADYRSADCNGEVENNSVTHSHPGNRQHVSLQWIAPRERGTYVILTTVVQSGRIYWVKQASANITVV